MVIALHYGLVWWRAFYCFHYMIHLCMQIREDLRLCMQIREHLRLRLQICEDLRFSL